MKAGQRQPRLLLPNPAVPGTLLVPLTRGLFAIIDEADREPVDRYPWSAVVSKRTYYAVTTLPRTPGKRPVIQLHRLLWRHWRMPETPEVDHRNGNGLDCRRENLRAATRRQNAWNARAPITNTSGIKGVSWDKERQRWRAKILIDGKIKKLGSFSTSEEAGRAYAEAAIRRAGEFARTGL